MASLSEAAGGPVTPVLEAAELAVQRRRHRARHLERLRAEIEDVAMLYVPELFVRTHGIRATTQVADALEAEL